MRVSRRSSSAGTSALWALLSLAAGAGCAVSDLERLGAGSSALGADAGVPLTADHLQHGRPPQLGPVSPADAGSNAASRPPSPELIPNPGFESGHAGWMGFGDSRIIDVAEAHSGGRSILATNRQWTWEGPGYDIRTLVNTGKPYAVSAWVRNEFGSDSIILTLKTQCSGAATYTRLATRAVGAEWLRIDASFFAPSCADTEELEELVLYVEGPAAYKNLLVDDVSLRSTLIGTSEDGDSDDDQGQNEQ